MYVNETRHEHAMTETSRAETFHAGCGLFPSHEL